MRRTAAFLTLLLCLYWTRAQGESGGLTEKDVTQTNITPDIWAELKELRDMLRKLEQENTAIQARLTASEIKNAVLEARINSTELQVEELKGQNAERKVAFSVGLTNEGRVGLISNDITLKFNKIFTNIGQAYNSSAGVFTAPVRGAYYFRFTAFEWSYGNLAGFKLYHNDKQITYSYDKVISDGYATVSNAFVLHLEKGDVIYLDLCSGCSVFDDFNNLNTFSGFLIFAM